jgi:putative ABC transport system ATP-binding protein
LVIVATHDDRVTQLADRVVQLAPRFTDADSPPEKVHLAAGEVLFEQGDRGELIYTVESGRLEVFRRLVDGGKEHIVEVGPGQYVGELGPVLKIPRSASVVAVEESVLTAYTVTTFRRQFPDRSPV